MDPGLCYEEIVARMVAEYPDAQSTPRSVASVAAVLKKKGTQVPMRRRSEAS